MDRRKFGEYAQVLDRPWDIDESGFAQRCAKVARFEFGEFGSMFFDQVGNCIEDAGTFVTGGVGPGTAIERLARCRYRAIDVGGDAVMAVLPPKPERGTEPPAPIASVSTARIAATRRSALAPATVWADRRGLIPAR